MRPVRSPSRWLPLLVPALALAACGEDHTANDVPLPGDTSGADVGGVGAWSMALVQPSDGATYPDGAPLPIEVAVNAPVGVDVAGFVVAVAVDGAPAASALAPDAAGVCRHALTVAYGERTIRVDVTAPDGTTRSVERVVLVNTPPEAPRVTITPEGAGTDDRLEATIDPASVADPSRKSGAELPLTYTWRRVGDTAVLSSAAYLDATQTERGEVYEVLVQADDGWALSPVGRDELRIDNAAPTCGAVLMTPAAASATTDVTCRCTDFDDPEGDADHSTCVFTDLTTDTVLPTGGACTLPAGQLAAGMQIGCTLTPDDGTSPGSSVTTRPEAAVSVLDAAPSAPVARLDPAAAHAASELACLLATPGVDPDGATVTHAVSWTVAGVAAATTATTIVPGELDAARGDAVCCRITASDGKSDTASSPACVTLGNAPPDEVPVFVTTDGGAASRRSTLTCAPQGASDPDGDALVTTFTWAVGGEVIAGATGATLSAAGLALGAVVTCTATLCDAEGACTPPIDSKLGVTITNAAPTIDEVDIVDDDAEATPGETLACTYEGWDDPDGDPASVTFVWVLVALDGSETVLDDATAAELVVAGDLAVGARLVCRVTPWNGTTPGASVDSLPIVVGAPDPVAPVVRLDAPAGADGALTCAVATPGAWIPTNATWTWRWSINGAPVAGATGATLAADAVDHCDLARCWVEIAAPGLALTSNQPTALMPLGADCEDGNPCTTALCLAAGGCHTVSQDGGACDDGDPCTSEETCSDGACLGTVDVCIEDRLSLDVASARPFLAATADGGYLAQWFDATALSGILRLTDGDESRAGDETRTYPTAVTRPIGIGQQAVTPSGAIGLVRSGNTQVITCNCVGDYTSPVYLRRFAPDMASFDEVDIGTVGVGVTCSGFCFGRIHENRSEVVAFADESLGALWAYEHPFQRSGIRLRLVYASLATDPMKVLVTGGELYKHDRWDAERVPDGSDDVVIVWVGAGGKSLYAQRFAQDGNERDADPILVATLANEVTAVAVTALANGRFVVVWEGVGADASGVGIAGQRYDDAGAKLGDAFVVPAVETGEQRLGGIAGLPGYGFVVTYRDASTPTARQLARLFSAGAAGQAAIVMNEASAIGAAAASVTALTSGEWVAAWADASGTLWTRRYTAAGVLAPRAAEIRANRTTSGMQASPAAAGSQGGHVLVAFASKIYPAAALGQEIVTRVFDADGVEVRAEAIANTTLAGVQSTPAVAAGADRFVVAWNSEEEDGSADGIFARVFDDMGDALGAVVPVNTTTLDFQRQPAVAMAPDGRWIAAWNAASSEAGSASDVVVRAFGPTGAATAEVRVNEVVAQPQERPAVAMVPFAPHAIVAWQSRGQDGDGYGVFVRRVGLDGVPDGPELQVNTTTAGDQKNPTVAVSQTGTTYVCWESVGQGPSGRTAVACQRLQTATLIPQGGELVPLARAADQVSPIARWQADGRVALAFAAPGVDSALLGVQLVRLTNAGVEVTPHVVANRTWSADQLEPWLVPQDDRVFVGWQSNLQDGAEGGIYFRVLPVAP